MEGRLTQLTTGKLLEKFGAGNHKPGSGSASALQGMISAQMLRTVIDLTNEPKRKALYGEHIKELLKIKNQIEKTIYPKLETLFQEDSEYFDKVIQLRELRDKETNPQKKGQRISDAREALKTATEIPIKIAQLCQQLGDFATYVFDYGFTAARGDSGVALNSAIAAIASCLSIIELNLISIPSDKWMEEIVKTKTNLKKRYEQLILESGQKLKVLETEAEKIREFHKSVSAFRTGNLADSIQTNQEIENIVRNLQNTIWLNRDSIWKQNAPTSPLEILKPEVILRKVMDYTCSRTNTLGIYEVDGDLFEIAGLIDKKQRLVQVSGNFPQETQTFTLAHELGHSILHRQTVLHRDKPIDGGSIISRSQEEMQADKFAAYFLMPATLVEEVFIGFFETERFAINEGNVLALKAGNVHLLRQRCQNIRGLSRLLASTDYFAGKSFKPIANVFGVSIETMAIRFEELNLLEY